MSNSDKPKGNRNAGAPGALPPIELCEDYVEKSEIDRYNVLRETIANTLSAIAVDRTALRQQLKDSMAVVAVRTGAIDEADLAIHEATDKLNAENARIQRLAAEDQKRVAAAQAELDRIIATDDEKAMQTAAEQLHEAQTQQQAGSLKLNGLRLRLAGHQSIVAAKQKQLDEATAAWQEAWEDVRQVELKLALLESDEAMVRALAAHLRVRQARSLVADKKPALLVGIEGASFWFSAPDRAVRWNNTLNTNGTREGPVAISGANLNRLAVEATLPAGATPALTSLDEVTT